MWTTAAAGGYGYVTYGDGNTGCNATTVWPDPGLHGAGFTFSHTFTQAGTFNYFCDMHLGAMKGQVVVLAGASGPCDPSVADEPVPERRPLPGDGGLGARRPTRATEPASS